MPAHFHLHLVVPWADHVPELDVLALQVVAGADRRVAAIGFLKSVVEARARGVRINRFKSTYVERILI